MHDVFVHSIICRHGLHHQRFLRCPVAAAVSSADTSHPQGSGAPGFAYWDGFSFDGANANIGYFINGTGFFAGDAASPRALLPYWGNPDGSAVNSFYFTSGGLPQVASLLEGNGLWSSNDSLGWYDPNSSLWGWIFQSNGSPVVPTSVVFDPTASFGLFFVPNSSTFDPTKSYFTNDSLNGIADADRAYALANGITLGPETSAFRAIPGWCQLGTTLV